jgi:G3E family GTPase
MAEGLRGDGRLPLTILGGFLGAGKSTWLRHQLHEGRFARHHVLVNEAAETPVDNLLLGGAARMTVLAGGCACCEGLPALIAALRAICDSVSGAEAGMIDGILLETSGLADPGSIAAALSADPVLVHRLAIAGTLVLVDARHGLEQLAAEPLARAQVEAAERLIITKPTEVEPTSLACLAATLRGMNPVTGISAAELGVDVPLPDIPAQAHVLQPLSEATPIRPHRLRIGTEGGWIALSTWLSALLHARGEDVVRVKGVVRTPAGRLLLQSVRRVVQAPEILPDDDGPLSGQAPEEGVIVLIGRNIDDKALARSWELFGV